jgi:phage replication-related protein YjqB (UPF0714/DUF867 family)
MAPDTYMNFADLKAHQVYGVDYSCCLLKRESKFLVAAVHGGGIEPGTSQIAQGVAGVDRSLYLFEGHKSSGNGALHITSHRFDEPHLLRVFDDWGDQLVVMAVHGVSNAASSNHDALVGGRNTRLKELVIQELKAVGMQAADASSVNPGLAGLDPLNICNRGNEAGGVQLEFSRAYRDSLFQGNRAKGTGGTTTARFDTLCSALRQALDMC